MQGWREWKQDFLVMKIEPFSIFLIISFNIIVEKNNNFFWESLHKLSAWMARRWQWNGWYGSGIEIGFLQSGVGCINSKSELSVDSHIWLASLSQRWSFWWEEEIAVNDISSSEILTKNINSTCVCVGNLSKQKFLLLCNYDDDILHMYVHWACIVSKHTKFIHECTSFKLSCLRIHLSLTIYENLYTSLIKFIHRQWFSSFFVYKIFIQPFTSTVHEESKWCW